MEAETKIIAITGAAMGLGRALARQLVSVGHRVILLGRTRTTLDKLASELGSSASVEVCDVSSPHSVKAVFDSIAKQYAVIDVLINNAAVYEPFFVKDATDEQISAAMNTNFAGPVYCSRAVIPLMKAGSHIVNISSETVGENHAMFSLYQSSKAGLERFTEALHDELNPDGIRVTLARAGQMMDADSRPPGDGEDRAGRGRSDPQGGGAGLRHVPEASGAGADHAVPDPSCPWRC